MTDSGLAGGRARDGSIFRESARQRYLSGEPVQQWRPLRQPPALRALWAVLALALACVAWVGSRPVPAFVETDIALLAHDCGDTAAVVAADASLHAALEPGSRVVLERRDPARGVLTVARAAREPVPARRIADTLGCPVEVGPLGAGAYAVALATPADAGEHATTPAGALPARVEVGERRLVSLLPLWPGPGAPDPSGGEGR